MSNRPEPKIAFGDRAYKFALDFNRACDVEQELGGPFVSFAEALRAVGAGDVTVTRIILRQCLRDAAGEMPTLDVAGKIIGALTYEEVAKMIVASSENMFLGEAA